MGCTPGAAPAGSDSSAPAAGSCLISASFTESQGKEAAAEQELVVLRVRMETLSPVHAAGGTSRALPKISQCPRGMWESCSRSGAALGQTHHPSSHLQESCSPASAPLLSSHHPAGPIHTTPIPSAPCHQGKPPKNLRANQRGLHPPGVPHPRVAGDARVPLSDTLSAPNPDMRRQLGAGIPFPRRQMGRSAAVGLGLGRRGRLCLLMCLQILPS